jgi:hypothetical protein
MAVHVRNGFYANAWFDRMIHALDLVSPDSRQALVTPATTHNQKQNRH